MATGASFEPLSFESIAEKVQQVSAKKALPTAVLTGTLDDREVRVLAYLVRCRSSGFMMVLPALEEVQGILNQLVDEGGDALFVVKEVEAPLESLDLAPCCWSISCQTAQLSLHALQL